MLPEQRQAQTDRRVLAGCRKIARLRATNNARSADQGEAGGDREEAFFVHAWIVTSGGSENAYWLKAAGNLILTLLRRGQVNGNPIASVAYNAFFRTV